MARILLVVAVCYCAICAQVNAETETNVRRNQLETNIKLDSVQLTKPYTNIVKTNVNDEETIHSKMPIDFREQNVPKKLRGRRKYAPNLSEYDDDNEWNSDLNDYPAEFSYERFRRHTGGHGPTNNDDDYDKEHASKFVKKLFEQFGVGDRQTMNVIGFEKMLKHLGLYRFFEDSNPTETPLNGGVVNSDRNSFKSETCLSSIDLISRVSSVAHILDLDDNNNSNKSLPVNNINQTDTIVTATNLISLNVTAAIAAAVNNATSSNQTAAINSIKQNLFLNQNDLWSICPILLYQLTAASSLERSGCIDPALLPIQTQHQHHHHMDAFEKDSRTWVWIYATLSIIGASLCGLLGVAVIPCMERHYYQHILQFFVALAVGTLAGDALLHLLPHAMMTFSSLEDSHDSMTWRGLVATLGIIFFFLTERILTMIAEWRKKIQKRDDPPGMVRVMRDPDTVSVNHSLNGEKQCKHKYSSYPYCYDEIAMETKDDHHHHHHHQQQPPHSNPHHHPHNHGHTHKENGLKSAIAGSPKSRTPNHADGEHPDTAQSLLAPHTNYTISGSAYFNNGAGGDRSDAKTPGNRTLLTNVDGGSVDACGCVEPKKEDENFTIILREHESKHHGHSHTHGHVHSPPKSLSAVAWMVVMGDGLHNFTDGMAIGAAFSNSIAGGFSTAIAVFCHELPHELGDFAVLLKAGMSARKAVYYNVLSSVLSLFGMILGILFGDTPEASAWIFSAAAGMFIYIALVDMVPELTTAHNESCAITQCLLQASGMVLGLCIMLVIALYERDLKIMFSPDDHHHSH